MKKIYEDIIQLYRGDMTARLQAMIHEYENKSGIGKISDQLEKERLYFLENEKSVKR